MLLNALRQLVDQTARTLARKAGGHAALVAVAQPLPGGNRGLAWAVGEVTADDMEMLAYGLLARIEEVHAKGAMSCEGCAERQRRAIAAMAVLKVQPGEKTPVHLH